jgi:serine/threonine protein kinase
MTELPGRSSPASYTILETLCHQRSTVLHLARRDADERPVVLKVLDPRRSRPKDLEQLKREYEIGRLFDTPAVVRPLALETYQGMPALVLEASGGRSLDRLLGAPMPMDRFLPIAIGIAFAIADVHERGVTHRDLKPHNILVSPAGDEVKIANFGLASRFPRERNPSPPVQLIEGSLPYLAPEQTGRINRIRWASRSTRCSRGGSPSRRRIPWSGSTVTSPVPRPRPRRSCPRCPRPSPASS